MRMGRPTIDKKESTIKLRLNDEMREWIEVKADEANVSMSEYIRYLIKCDMPGDIRFSFTPETVREATKVLRNELLKHGDLYDGFLASMRSVVDDKFWNSRSTVGYMRDIGQEDFDEVAELMLKRLIGD